MKSLLTTDREVVVYIPAKKFHAGYIIGSALFGIGWGLTGACPEPIFVIIGSGYSVSIMVLLSALAGTWVYSYFRNKLPHHTKINWRSGEEEEEEKRLQSSNFQPITHKACAMRKINL